MFGESIIKAKTFPVFEKLGNNGIVKLYGTRLTRTRHGNNTRERKGIRRRSIIGVFSSGRHFVLRRLIEKRVNSKGKLCRVERIWLIRRTRLEMFVERIGVRISLERIRVKMSVGGIALEILACGKVLEMSVERVGRWQDWTRDSCA